MKSKPFWCFRINSLLILTEELGITSLFVIGGSQKALCFAEMAHESAAGGAGAPGSPQHAPSPPHVPRLPPDTSFHQQIMQVRILSYPGLTVQLFL